MFESIKNPKKTLYIPLENQSIEEKKKRENIDKGTLCVKV
jgi:hypothetical protein